MARPARLAADTAKKREGKRTKEWAEKRKRRLVAEVAEPEEKDKLRTEESVEERKKRRRRPPAETREPEALDEGKENPVGDGTGEDRRDKRKRATKGQYEKATDSKTKERAEAGERRKEKYLEGITARDFLEFYEQLYLLTRDEEPVWGWQINQFRDDERWVTVAAEEEPEFVEMIENEFFDTVERWCGNHTVKLDRRKDNLCAYDRLGEFGQKLLKENSDMFKRWYFKLFRLTYIERELEVQKERALTNFALNPPGDLSPEMLMDGDKIDSFIERIALEEMKDLLANRLMEVEKRLKKSDKLWPSDYQWWLRSNDARYASLRYKFFEIILIELEKLRLGFLNSRKLFDEYKLDPPDEGKIWALLDHKRINAVMKNAGVKMKTFVKYRAALLDISYKPTRKMKHAGTGAAWAPRCRSSRSWI